MYFTHIPKHMANIRREKWQDVVREELICTILLGRWAEGSKKTISQLPQAIFFLGRDDKYSSHLMTMAHILCNETLLSKGERYLWEVPHILSLSRMLVTVPGTVSPVSELSTFLSTWSFACSLATAEPKPGGGGLCSRIRACSIRPQRKGHTVFSLSIFCTNIPWNQRICSLPWIFHFCFLCWGYCSNRPLGTR